MLHRNEDTLYPNLKRQTTLVAQFIRSVGSLASRLIQALQDMHVIGQFSTTTTRLHL